MNTPFPKIVKTFPGPIRSFTVKGNNIGSVVSEILRDRQKTLTTLYNRIDMFEILQVSRENIRKIFMRKKVYLR